MVELHYLRSFLAVADSLSFVRASHTLHLSQPALTSQIQKLEEQIGVQLFFRNKRVVRLTDAGNILVEEARDLLARSAKAIERTQRASRGEVGLLRIGFVSSAALVVVPSLVEVFRKRHPEVQLDMLNLRTSDQLEQLAAGMIDIGFVRLPASHKRLEFTRIHTEPLVMAFSEQHPLARKKSVKLRDLSQESFILYGRRWAPGFFDHVMRLCANSGFVPHIVQETGEMYTAISLLSVGHEVSIVPRSVVLAQASGVVHRNIAQATAVSEIAIATRTGESSALVMHFVELAVASQRQIRNKRQLRS